MSLQNNAAHRGLLFQTILQEEIPSSAIIPMQVIDIIMESNEYNNLIVNMRLPQALTHMMNLHGDWWLY